MKNGRCRMLGGKCRGPTTEEGRARISAALDKGKMRGKQWQGVNDATNRMKRHGRVYRAMLDAHMLPPDIAPIVRDVRAFLELPDPGYDGTSLESTRHYACMELMELGPDPMAGQCLASRIREAGRRRPTNMQVKIPKNARHREDPPVTAVAEPDAAAEDAVNLRDMPCTVRQPIESPAKVASPGNTCPVSEVRFSRTIFGRYVTRLAAKRAESMQREKAFPGPAIRAHRPTSGCWYVRARTGRPAGLGRRVPLGVIRGPEWRCAAPSSCGRRPS